MSKNIVRTPKKVSGGITAAEKTAMDLHTKMWISRIMRTDTVDRKALTTAIEDLYEVSGLKKPRVVIVPSPLVMAFAYGAATAIWKNRIVDSATHLATYSATYSATDSATNSATNSATSSATHLATNSATSSATHLATDLATSLATDSATHSATSLATRSATYSATLSATRSATDSATRSATNSATRSATDSATNSATRSATDSATDLATRSATDSATRSATRSATYSATDSATDLATDLATDSAAQVCFELAGEEGLKYAKQWRNAYQGGAYWAYYDCYLTAFRDVLGLDLPEYEKYDAWERAAIHGTFRVMHEEFCIVSDFPEILRVDDQNRPHCEFGPSHRWRDGWELYHWHGVKIPDEWIRDKSLDAKTALTWKNIEQRRAACEIVGWNNILKELNATIINDDGDPEIGTLLEVNIPDIGRERFLRVKCGTGREFALPVPPTMLTAIEANAWTYGLDLKDYMKPEVRT